MESTLGKRILQNRKNLGMTQDQLAERIGVTAQAISKWENDQSCPDIAMLPRLAALFGVSTDELLGIAPKPPAAASPEPEGGISQAPSVDAKGGGWEFHWDGGSRPNIVLALWLLLSGALLLASNWLGWDAGLWGILWPSYLVVYGIFGFTTWHFSFKRLVSLLVGGCFLLENLGVFQLPDAFYLPIGLLVIGAGLLLDGLRTKKKPTLRISHKREDDSSHSATLSQTEDAFTYSGSHCEDKQAVELPELKSGKIDLSLGSLELDLTGCEAFAQDCRLDISAAFGAVTLLLPRTCRVKPKGNTGCLTITGEEDSDAPCVLVLDCDVRYSQVCVRYI